MRAVHADLAALRELVDAAERISHCSTLADVNGCGAVREDPAPIERLCLAIRPAREALEALCDRWRWSDDE